MKCPVCQVALRETHLEEEYEFEALDVCPQCQGIWFDKGELDRLDGSMWVNIEHHGFLERQGDGHRQVKCPKCDVLLKPLSPSEEPDLIIDRCPSCEGFWLDSGELEHLRSVTDQVHTDLAKESIKGKKLGTWAQIRQAARRLVRGRSK